MCIRDRSCVHYIKYLCVINMTMILFITAYFYTCLLYTSPHMWAIQPAYVGCTVYTLSLIHISNALYWATSTPNLGFEVGLAKKLTLDISGNYNPWKFGDDRQIKHTCLSVT